MIELMIVIGIIGLLVAIALVVAKSATNGGKESSTLNTIRALEMSLTQYVAAKDGLPPKDYVSVDPNNTANTWRYPIVDGQLVGGPGPGPGNAPVPSLALYLLVAKDVPAVDSLIKGLDSRLVRMVTLPSFAGAPPLQSVEVLDGFGHPIRFVHPSYDGGFGEYFWMADGKPGGEPLDGQWHPSPAPPQHPTRPELVIGAQTYRRSYAPIGPLTDATGGPPNPGDGDEGICPGRHPYFYSAGADGDPGSRADNIYSARPKFPEENALEPR